MKRNYLLALIFLFLLPLFSMGAPKKIWIDADIKLGKARRDADNGIGLIMALESDSVQIIGIGLVMEVEHGFNVANRFVDLYGKGVKIPIYKGAHRPAEGGRKTEAVEGLAAALRKQKMTIVALGPVTNITTTLLLYPELKDSVERLVLCMGRRPTMHFRPGHNNKWIGDYNFDVDASAAQYLVASKIPVTLCGYEAASSIYLKKGDYEFLKSSGKESGKWLYDRFVKLSTGWKFYYLSKGFIPFDAVMMAYVLNPSLLEVEKNIPVDVQTKENDAKMFGDFGEEKDFLVVAKDIQPDRTVDYCYKVKQGCKDYILGLLKKTVQ